jgi:hypothetical protein
MTESGQMNFESIERNMEAFYRGIVEAIPENKTRQVIESLEILLNAMEKSKCC